MSNKEFDLLVFIGRFQPYHNGHHSVVMEAMKLSKYVLVLVGSANRVPDTRNPFSFEDRKKMIIHSLPEKYHDEMVMVAPINDHPYDENEWIAEVQAEIKKTSDTFGCKKIGLIGHSKDHSSYYLKLFPNLESVDVRGIDENGVLLNATDLREDFFTNPPNPSLHNYISSKIPKGTKEVLDGFHNPEFKNICEEMKYIASYERQYGPGPFVTVDAVVYQAGHILLIERGDHPGKGLMALPGGFVEPRERLEDAVLRELNEETSIDIPPAVLKNKMSAPQHFAYPYRSNRAHIITFAFLFDLSSEVDRKERAWSWKTVKKGIFNPIGFTQVKGGDDAAKAFWYPVSELKPELLFEDHSFIISTMLDKMAVDKL